jgi:class 3 adenylate cyclase/Tfp pilus assembly protein PilF
MKKNIVLLFLLLPCIHTAAQVKCDSLWNIWNDETAADTGRASALYKMIHECYLYSDSAIYFCRILYDFATQRDLKKHMADALNTQGISYYIHSDYAKALEYYQKSMSIREEINEIRGIAVGLNNIGMIYARQGDYSRAMENYQQCLEVLKGTPHFLVKASALNNIGKISMILGDYPGAVDYYQRSYDIYEGINDQEGMAGALNNLGSIYINQGFYAKALDYYERSYRIREALSIKREMAGSLNNIGLIYLNRKDYAKALEYMFRSLKIKEEISEKNGMALTMNNIGTIFKSQGNYPKALEYFEESLKIRQEIAHKRGIAETLNNIGEIYLDQEDFTTALDYFQRSLGISEEISDKRKMAVTLNNFGKLYIDSGAYFQAIRWSEQALAISENIQALLVQKNACQSLYNAHKSLGNQGKALEYFERIMVLNDTLQEEETAKKLQQMEFARQILADSLVREQEKLSMQIAHEAEVRKKNMTRNILILSALFLMIGALGIYRRMVYIRRAKSVIENEKERSDKLLLNILPAEIAEELKEKGRAEARKFDMVSILFSDFKEFTQLSQKLSAEELVGEINTCFKAFDAICNKYGIEKIKTIGDSYMAAGGLPVATDDALKKTVLAGIEMKDFMIKRKTEQQAIGKISFEMRVGIHTGPVVAGIVGVTKFQYDVWGDTVNTASRIESCGEAGKVNISRSVFDLIRDDHSFVFQQRGGIQTKGKGEIDMWFVERAT